MRKILMILVLFVSLKMIGQDRVPFVFTLPENSHLADYFGIPTNYQYRTVRERLLAMMVDSSFHIPRYNGVPSGLRVGSSNNDGLLASDTLNGHVYHYWNLAWNRLANYEDIAGAGINIYNSDGYITDDDRYVKGLNDTKGVVFDSLNYFLLTRNNVTRFYMNNLVTRINAPDESQYFGTENAASYVIADNNFMQWETDSTESRRKIVYPSNIHGTFNAYTLVDKSYVDSVATNLDFIVVNEANVENNSWLKYDEDNDEYDVFSIDSLNGKMEFITGVTGGGFPANGDSIMTDSNFIYRHIEIDREGDRQSRLAFNNYYYEHDSTNGNIIFHPPLVNGERVIIYTSWIATWSFLHRRTAPSPLVWTAIDFETNTNLSESPANQWQASTGAGWGQTGLNDTYKIPASTEAAYRTQITAATQWKYIMGIGTDDAEVGYASFTRGVLVQHNGSNFDIYRTSGASTFDTGVDLDVGDYCALWRYADGTVKIRKSVDGTNWTDVYAYGATSTADMFFKIDVNYISGPSSFGILVNPQVTNQAAQ